MSTRAKITVTTGPDRGKSIGLSGDLLRLGRAPENDFVLTDTDLAEHLASVVERDGRYAIITTVPGGLEIDGTELPVERWVWLPEEAQIRISRRTILQFIQESNGAEEDSAVDAATTGTVPAAGSRLAGTRSVAPTKSETAAPRRPVPKPAGSSGEVRRPSPKRAAGERVEAKKRTVARFITDGPGDPLVRLGEDGHLPELALKEGAVREGHEAAPRSTNPTVLAVGLCFSIGITMLMLFMDTGGFGDNTAQKAAARAEIVEYYGAENDDLKPYQYHLRQARQARGRGDSETERAEYRKVLAQLRSEAKDKLYRYTGITGRLDYADTDDNRKSDRRLEELIAILLSE
jgi:hypothetical protein